jgi:membrane protein required for beta-lactamase induction
MKSVDLEKEYTLLTIVSFFFGIFVLIVTLQRVTHGGLGLSSILVAGLFGLGAGLLYPVVGAAVVRLRRAQVVAIRVISNAEQTSEDHFGGFGR